MIRVSDIEVQVVRKDIKNLYLRVHRPDGRVQVSAPLHVTDDDVRLAVTSKLKWIRKKQSRNKGDRFISHYLPPRHSLH